MKEAIKTPQETKAAYCHACKKYLQEWLECQELQEKALYEGVARNRKLFKRMYSEAMEIHNNHQDIAEEVLESGICDRCEMPSSIYNIVDVGRCLLSATVLHEYLKDRGETDVKTILSKLNMHRKRADEYDDSEFFVIAQELESEC